MRLFRVVIFFFFCYQVSFSQSIDELLYKAYISKDSSEYFFLKAKNKLKNTEDEALYFLSKNARHLDFGSPDSAVYYGKIALDKYRKTTKKSHLFTTYNNIANAYKKKGSYNEAIQYALTALREAEKEKNDYWIGTFNVALALQYHDFENYELGVKYGKAALEVFQKNQKKDLMSLYSAINAIAINYDDWKKPELALKYHFLVFKYIKGKDTLNISSTYNNIGNTYLKQKKYKEAKNWISRAVAIEEQSPSREQNVNYYYSQATNYTNLATIASELNQIKEAELLFEKAYAFVKLSKSAEKKRDYYYQKIQFSKKKNDLQEVINNQDNYIRIRDSLFISERTKAVAEAEAKYQTEKKEKEILLVKNNLFKEEVANKKKSYWLIGSALFILICILIGFLLYRQQKLKLKQQQQEFQLKNAIRDIENQNKLHEQRIAISRDLHDNIGAQLTFIISTLDNLKFGFPNLDNSIKNKLYNISTFTKDTIIELRDTIWAMNTNEFTFEDLKVRILNFLENAKKAQEEIGFNFTIDDSLKSYSFSSVLGINVYRTIQEAVNNALKYANCSEINVNVTNQNGILNIEIMDNGIGFKTSEILLGNGLNNMKQRIEEIDGVFSILSDKEIGTKIIIQLKID
ncbi:tetratricopeptide repeat-containing sensor histidine kinase [Flavobacterium difficile]|uniref:histidine kinase n=1 Tax=Flavobacterium difficile TaxID=2709659 RepID=A0ABX0I5J6_9FLAO|nr:tetratricopeptide repeat protein [Flavobacterium difficile]NHM00820.1 tetratricopeptide repeat protein [Flavobacterium difficile]